MAFLDYRHTHPVTPEQSQTAQKPSEHETTPTVAPTTPAAPVWGLTALPPPFSPPLLKSTFDKMLFSCDVPPPTPDDVAKHPHAKEILQNDVKAWGEIVGVDMQVSDITNGISIDVEGKTDEAKMRLWRLGFKDINKFSLQFRRIGDNIFVTYVFEFPPSLKPVLLFTPNPYSDDLQILRRLTESLTHAADGHCRMF
jgi:hypothetical protein